MENDLHSFIKFTELCTEHKPGILQKSIKFYVLDLTLLGSFSRLRF